MVPVERVVTRTEYIPVERKIVHYPETPLATTATTGIVTGGLVTGGYGGQVVSGGYIGGATTVLPAATTYATR